MKHLAVYMMLKLGGNDAPTKEDVTTALDAVGIEADAEALDMMFSELEGKDFDEIMTMGRAKLASFGSGGGGGGGGGGAAAAGDAEDAKEEKKEEEEEEEIDMYVLCFHRYLLRFHALNLAGAVAWTCLATMVAETITRHGVLVHRTRRILWDKPLFMNKPKLSYLEINPKKRVLVCERWLR